MVKRGINALTGAGMTAGGGSGIGANFSNFGNWVVELIRFSTSFNPSTCLTMAGRPHRTGC